MSEGNDLRVLSIESSGRRLTRREVVQRLLASAGAGAAWPLMATGHPIHEHFANHAVLAEADKLGAADWKPLFLSAEQNEELIALAESTVPGSTRAFANRFIDLLLSVDTPANQKKFAASLTAIDGEAKKRFGRSFPALDAGQRDALLTSASTKAADDDKAASELREHFENLKGWVSGAYYSSEAGMRELGWRGEFAFASYPGCEHAEGHS
jgi:Gluconate 2-dehydrogenase subunit 3